MKNELDKFNKSLKMSEETNHKVEDIYKNS